VKSSPRRQTPAKPRFLAAMNTGQRVHRPRRGAGSYDRNQQSLKRVLDALNQMSRKSNYFQLISIGIPIGIILEFSIPK
jgi:hypothetical protein